MPSPARGVFHQVSYTSLYLRISPYISRLLERLLSRRERLTHCNHARPFSSSPSSSSSAAAAVAAAAAAAAARLSGR